jgi:predicted membrane-bound spermidine synthase
MSLLYREKDQYLYREYSLLSDITPLSFQTKRALVDIVETKEYGSMFFLDGVLQCSSADEYIYHEFLVHIPMAYAESNETICILGGGDGCAARELLKWKDVSAIDLYDWDFQLVDYFKTRGKLWNQDSLKNPKVFFQSSDVTALFKNSEENRYDVLLVDLLDPEYRDLQGENGFWINLLKLVKRWRKQGGSIVINAGGITPWQTECFSLLRHLCKSIFPDLYVIPYKVFVPTFGREWAFLLIVEKNSKCKAFPPFLRRLNEFTFRNSYAWEPDFKIEV